MQPVVKLSKMANSAVSLVLVLICLFLPDASRCPSGGAPFQSWHKDMSHMGSLLEGAN